MKTWPCVDHSILSPSGRCSKRARKAALKREHGRLFPPGYWDEPVKSPEQLAEERRRSLLAHAARLRDLAERGMNSRAYFREAARIEAEVAAMNEES